MVAAGCDRVFDMSRHSAMLLGALQAVGRAARMMQTCDAYLRRYPFAAAVLIDSPTLHLPLARRAHAVGVPVLYYIAPQMWAWGAYRMHKLRNHVDRVAVILPFEEKFFRDHGVNATFVGHPLQDQWAVQSIDPAAVDEIRSYGQPVVALLPGSRKHVVQEVLRGQVAVAERIREAVPEATFGVSVANPQVALMIHQQIGRSRAPIRAYPGRHAELLQAADLVLVASGTSTLEVAFHERPMIVMYNASRVGYQLIGRWLIRAGYLSLPNILAGREIVPEFMPYYTSIEPIAERAIALLTSDEARGEMQAALADVVRPLRETRASERTASLLLDMIATAAH
jgi:lipid-A-disaccharide synthase